MFFEITGAHSTERDERSLIVKGNNTQVAEAIKGTGARAKRLLQPDDDQQFDYDLTGENAGRGAATSVETAMRELFNELEDWQANPPREDNETFVQRIMTSGSPLRQAFILTAITKYAEACAESDPMLFDSAFMNGHAWYQMAVEIKAELDKRAAS